MKKKGLEEKYANKKRTTEVFAFAEQRLIFDEKNTCFIIYVFFSAKYFILSVSVKSDKKYYPLL